MSLLNHSTVVPVHRTIGEVTAILVAAGARRVMTDYDDDGTPTSLTFSLTTAQGDRAFTLPVRVERVTAVLMADARMRNTYKTPEQGQRVAWRIAKDWLEAQLAIIESDMVTFDEVMLPYMRSDTGATFYQEYLMGSGTQPALPAGTGG